MSATQAAPIVPDTAAPAPTNPVGVTATVNADRDLVAEKQHEQQQDRAQEQAKRPRFMARKVTTLERPVSAAPEFETLIFKAAANDPLADLSDLTPSHYIPNFQVAFYLLNFMDHTMASTKRWIDNCMGWAPPISQMYVSVLLYVQIFRAMDAAGLLTPGSAISTFLTTFINVFPLSELWIPGPLVALFRAVSAFWPSANNDFGNVSPSLPRFPGWTRNNLFTLGMHNARDVPNYCLPNISFFVSRLRSVCTAATRANVNQATFSNDVDGPYYCATLFGQPLQDNAAEQSMFMSPAASFAYPDNLSLWQNAAAALNRLSIPQNLAAAGNRATTPVNEWTSFIRFAQIPNEHVWFGPVSAVMAKYSQFFNGSASLDSVAPNCSAAGAIKLRSAVGHDLLTLAEFTASAGDGSSTQVGSNNAAAHRTLRFQGRAVFDARLALRDVPDVNYFAAVSFGLNSYDDRTDQDSARTGEFWTLGPDRFGRNNLEVLPGMLSTIIREYHSDTRIIASKQ